MTGIFNEPNYGKRNRIVALVLVALAIVALLAVWLFADALIAVLAAFVTVAAVIGLWGYRSQGNTWPLSKLDREMNERDRRDDQR